MFAARVAVLVKSLPIRVWLGFQYIPSSTAEYVSSLHIRECIDGLQVPTATTYTPLSRRVGYLNCRDNMIRYHFRRRAWQDVLNLLNFMAFYTSNISSPSTAEYVGSLYVREHITDIKVPTPITYKPPFETCQISMYTRILRLPTYPGRRPPYLTERAARVAPRVAVGQLSRRLIRRRDRPTAFGLGRVPACHVRKRRARPVAMNPAARTKAKAGSHAPEASAPTWAAANPPA